MHDKIQRYSLRKLSVGLASVMVGACIFSVNGKTVKADVTSDQTNQVTKVQDQTATAQPQIEKKQASSAQNSVTGQPQKNLLDDLGKQKASAQSGDQAKAKNQENRLVDQINYKLTTNNSTDNKEDLGQNKVAPDKTKQAPATKSDAEKSIVRTSSAPKINNQSNDHAEDNSQSQNEQKLDLTKNSPKFAKKVLATNLIETNSSPTTNGGFDEATWGKLDVTKWQGSVQDGVYQLTDYTGDSNHIIVPNEADFEKAGKSTNGLQVGITPDTVQSLLLGNYQEQTIAFSKTNNQKIKAVGTDWSKAFSWSFGSYNDARLSEFDGSNLDVSHVTDMSYMFDGTEVSDLTSLANWDTSNVTNMNSMFLRNKISDLTPLINWDTSKVNNMGDMFGDNPDIIDLRPIANWNVSNVNVNNEGFMSIFGSDTELSAKLNLTNINNTKLMQGFLKEPDALAMATFITNNADLVKATTGKDLPNLTNTAKRTITFNLPHTEPKTITQTIYYKAIAPVQIDWSDPESDSGKIVQTYPVKESDWQLDTSKKNDDVIIDGVICFKPVKMPHINGYKAYLIKDPVNPTAFLVSFMAVPEQPQNNQSSNTQSSQKPAQPAQKQPEPIQNTSAPVESDKQVDQILNHISYTLMHNVSTYDNADSFEPAQNDSDSFEAPSDSTQKDDAAKPQKVNAAKHKKHIVKKRVVKRHKKHAKKYHLKRRSRKHSKRAKKRIMNRRRTSKKFKKYSLKKHIKRV